MRLLKWIVVAAVLVYLLAILAVVAALFLLGMLIAAGISAWLRHRDARRQARAELLERCEQQHQWVMAGDERGIYGPLYRAPHLSKNQYRRRVDRGR